MPLYFEVIVPFRKWKWSINEKLIEKPVLQKIDKKINEVTVLMDIPEWIMTDGDELFKFW